MSLNRPRVTKLLDILPSEGTCLPAFDVGGGQTDFVLGVLEACERARCPAVLNVYAPTKAYIPLAACAELVRLFARRASVPVDMGLRFTQPVGTEADPT